MIPDPDRPHALDDVIARMNQEQKADQSWASWLPSWNDICRVRDYMGTGWATLSSRFNWGDYELASMILHHLDEVQRSGVAIQPCLAIECTHCHVAAGVPCGRGEAMIWENAEVGLPGTWQVCLSRVLALHGRSEAIDLFEPSRRVLVSSGYRTIGVFEEGEGAIGTDGKLYRYQHRNPRPWISPRLTIGESDHWTIHDVRVNGVSVLLHHLDLPARAFGNSTLQSGFKLPTIQQDEWIEIDARPTRDNPRKLQAIALGLLKDPADPPDHPTDRLSPYHCVPSDKNRGEPMSEDLMSKILQQREEDVIQHLVACERIRKKLELPVDVMPLISQRLADGNVHTSHLHARHHDGPNHDPAHPQPVVRIVRSPLNLVSKDKIRKTDPESGKPTKVICRPQVILRVEEIEIVNNPDHWMVADVWVGNSSQLQQSGPPLPGRMFVPGETCHHFVTNTIPTGIDFVMLVHYVGPLEEGEIFHAVAMGISPETVDLR